MEKNYYIPQIVKIKRVVAEAVDTKTFFINKKSDFTPGQFLQVSALGLGEVPISLSSAPAEDHMQLTFKRKGRVTEALFQLGKNDELAIRGPFGNGFKIDELKGKNLIFIAEGLGFSSLRSLFVYCIQKRTKFSNITLLYGAESAEDLLYREEMKALSDVPNISVHLSVKKPGSSWCNEVGKVADLLSKLTIRSTNTVALISGSSLTMNSCIKKLLKKGMKKKSIFLHLERNMQCGVGKCGHCYMDKYFVCKDGPVFAFSDLDNLNQGEII